MSIQKRIAVFLDIDGTLITGDPIPFKDDVEAMEEAALKGNYIFLNTGRSFSNIPLALLELPFIKGIAAGGGAHVLFANNGSPRYQTVYHKWLPVEQLSKICAWCGNQRLCCVLEGEKNCYVFNQSSLIFKVESQIVVNSFNDFIRKSSGDFITKLTFIGFALKNEYPLLESICTVNYFPHYCEGIIKGENKAKAMELILQNLGLRREDSIAIGDSTNDLDMIRFAGMGIAMGNACAELKAAAGAVTGDCGKGGVAGALRKFVL